MSVPKGKISGGSSVKGKISGGGSVKGSLLTIPRIVNDLTTGGTSMALSAEMGKELNKRVGIYIGDNEPDIERVLWFNTAPGGLSGGVAMLSLREDESQSAVQAVIGDEVYGVDNATANGEATGQNYDFTVY